MSVAKLIDKIYRDELYWSMIRLVGYGYFPFQELAAKMKPLVEKYGPKRVSAAMIELLSHEGWWTRLNPAGKKASWGVLGPAPDHEWCWETWDHKPLDRPEPIIIPERQIDPMLDGLTRKTATELDMTLRQCRAVLRKKDSPDHQRQLAEEMIPRVESEMVRRGEPIPPLEPEEENPEEKAPKKKRTKKEKA